MPLSGSDSSSSNVPTHFESTNRSVNSGAGVGKPTKRTARRRDPAIEASCIEESAVIKSPPLLPLAASDRRPPQRTIEVKQPLIGDGVLRREGGSQPEITEEAIFLRLPRVLAIVGLSKSSLYELIRADSFPAPVQLGSRSVAWVTTEVRQWAAERILSSRKLPTPSVGTRGLPQRALPGQWASKKWA
jgi:prophage regulatory protein